MKKIFAATIAAIAIFLMACGSRVEIESDAPPEIPGISEESPESGFAGEPSTESTPAVESSYESASAGEPPEPDSISDDELPSESDSTSAPDENPESDGNAPTDNTPYAQVLHLCEAGFVWRVPPTLEFEHIHLCICGMFLDGDLSGREIDRETGHLTENSHAGHCGPPTVRFVYDRERNLFGEPAHYFGMDYISGVHPFDKRFERFGWNITDNLHYIRRVDSSLRRYSYWDTGFREIYGHYPWRLTPEAFSDEFAVMYNGEFVTDFIFDGGFVPLENWGVTHENFNTIAMRQNGKWGLIDKSGDTSAPFIFDRIHILNNSIAIALYDGKYGIIDHSGEIVIPFAFDRILNIDDNTVFARYNGRYGILDVFTRNAASEFSGLSTRTADIPAYGTNWRLIIEPIFNHASRVGNDRILARIGDDYDWENRQWDAIDLAGNILVPFEYDYSRARERILAEFPPTGEFFLQQRAERPASPVRVIGENEGDNRRFGLADSETGRIILEPVHTWVNILCEYLVAVMPEGEWRECDDGGEYLYGKWKIVDMRGREIAPPIYDGVSSFSPGIAAVAFGGPPFGHRWRPPFRAQWGLMNRHGEIILPLEHDYINTWGSNELRRVNIGGRWDWALGMQEGAYIEIIGGRWGFLNPDGTWAIPPEIPFDWVDWREHCDLGILMTEHNRRLGFIQLDLEKLP
ncbi:MAG: WG repeat-containing protein [Defluviitaleaceae bacterium]|nr:WG repeat-containing protein [Defluviitaleaceae bacterium]